MGVPRGWLGRFVPYLADTRFLERERDRNRKKKVSFFGKGRGTKKGTKDKKNLPPPRGCYIKPGSGSGSMSPGLFGKGT